MALPVNTAGNSAASDVKTIAEIPVNTKYTNAEGKVREAEEGLVGLTVHPEFEINPWVYLLYADPDEPKHVFARWDFKDDALIESTKKVVLEFPVRQSNLVDLECLERQFVLECLELRFLLEHQSIL